MTPQGPVMAALAHRYEAPGGDHTGKIRVHTTAPKWLLGDNCTNHCVIREILKLNKVHIQLSFITLSYSKRPYAFYFLVFTKAFNDRHCERHSDYSFFFFVAPHIFTLS